MSLFSMRLTTLLAAVSLATLSVQPVAAGGPPDYGDKRGDTPKDGHGTDGASYRRNTYGEVGTGSVLPGSLGGSTATTPEGIMNSGSYGVPAPGSGLDVLHQDEMRRLREHYAHKKANQKKDKETSGTAHHSESPKIVVVPGELTSPLNRTAPASAGPKRSVVRDHAVAAHPNTPGQGGARRDRSVPSTTAAPRLPAYPEKAGAQVDTPKANVAGVAWGRPVAQGEGQGH